ncbi:hypothetical protein JTE90_028413 [Oedothorax gibbosus]|uniref:Uncharacterized protein n=1 Tax=Oedothorax gibbosus TaxID=931172 RepID=A0AAV6VFJ4_9ARAC|nr:hypothetical protein JTE90_028413 [Oedothorax gibbosus]
MASRIILSDRTSVCRAPSPPVAFDLVSGTPHQPALSPEPSMYLFVNVCLNSSCGCWIGSSNGRRVFQLELSNRR